jgi:hypothetical protein
VVEQLLSDGLTIAKLQLNNDWTIAELWFLLVLFLYAPKE